MPYISDELNREIGELMDMLDVDEMDVLIKKPVPMEATNELLERI